MSLITVERDSAQHRRLKLAGLAVLALLAIAVPFFFGPFRVSQFTLALKLLGSANTANLSNFVLGMYLSPDEEVTRLGSVSPRPKLEFEGDWDGFARTLDKKFPHLTSVKMVEARYTNSHVSSHIDLSVPLEGMFQTALKNLFPSLHERGLLYFL